MADIELLEAATLCQNLKRVHVDFPERYIQVNHAERRALVTRRLLALSKLPVKDFLIRESWKVDLNANFLFLRDSKIETLRLARMPHLSNVSLTRLEQMTTLKSLEINSCNLITDFALTYIKRLRLTELSLKSIKFGENNLAGLSELSTLQKVTLGGSESVGYTLLTRTSNISDEGLKALGPLENLTELTLDDLPLVTNVGLRNIAEGCKQLKYLKMSNLSNVTTAGLQELKLSKSLRTIVLDYELRGLNVDAYKPLLELPSLNYIYFSGARVEPPAQFTEFIQQANRKGIVVQFFDPVSAN